MLGELPGYLSVGELAHIWERALGRDELCSCGQLFSGCPFWVEVGKLAFGGWQHVDAASLAKLRRSVDRTRYIPMMIAPQVFPHFAKRMERYARILERLYGAIQEVSGAAVIVDSSKHASYAFHLRRAQLGALTVVHLVRDSRAVATSLARRVRRPEGDGADFMQSQGPIRAGVEWSLFNGLFEVLAHLVPRQKRIRYEDFVRDPRSVIALLAPSVQEDDLSFIHDGAAELGAGHTVSGNPMRFRRGEVALKVDDDWRERMGRVDRLLVAAATWPLLLRYGYRVAS